MHPVLQTAADEVSLFPAGRRPRPALDGHRPGAGPPSTGPLLTLTPADVTLHRALGGTSYGPVSVSGSGTSYTITLAHPISTADRVTIAIAGGNIVPPYTRRLDVLPGDLNDDGSVNSQGTLRACATRCSA